MFKQLSITAVGATFIVLGTVGKAQGTGLFNPNTLGESVSVPINLNILSDSSWLSSDRYTPGWESISFDDSGWVPARASYPNSNLGDPATELLSDTNASLIWFDPKGTSNGTQGPNIAFFRKTFNLDLQTNSRTLVANAFSAADDDYELYVNGNLVLEDKDNGTIQVNNIDLSPYLRNGQNTFAIKAVDGRWSSPNNLAYEWVFFDARIDSSTPSTSTPEPVSVLGLLAMGAFGATYLKRK